MVKVKKTDLVPGVSRFGRARAIARRHRHLHFKKGAQVEKKEEKKAPKTEREPRFYAADDIRKKKFSRKNRSHPSKLKATITPGTILILLTGRFRGKRVVFLKQLPSGLLLVTGPYKVNGVPLRRINQAFVIGTSTKIDISGADLTGINDDFFKKEKKEKKKKDGEFFGEDKKKPELPQARKEAQKKVDSKLLPVIKKVPELRHYLNAKFSLTKGQYPHALKF